MKALARGRERLTRDRRNRKLKDLAHSLCFIGPSVLGVLIFFGFTLLWDNLGTVLVLVMALVVTCVCVGVVHSLLRHRDTLLLVLTFVVGIALTVGPRLIMSI